MVPTAFDFDMVVPLGGGRAECTVGVMADTDPFDDRSIDGRTPPSPRFIDWFHGNAPTDTPEALHHPLGSKAGQAAPGPHTHDGNDSALLLANDPVLIDPSDLEGLLAWAASVNSHLRRLGAGTPAP